MKLLSAFITDADDAEAAILANTLVRQKLDDNVVALPIPGKFEVNLDDDISNFELTIHFMGSNVSQTTLEQMIMNAYTTST